MCCHHHTQRGKTCSDHECICTMYLHVPFTTTSVITQSGQTAMMRAARRGHTKVGVELVKAKVVFDHEIEVVFD